eukprot:403359698
MAGEPEYILRNRKDIDDYLYEPESNFTNSEAQKMFDYLDFVMIDGDGNMLPWQKKCQRIGMLFRMCKRTNKCVFTSGIGMQFLVYFCATNFLNLQVINGQEKGGPLTSIKEVDARFLDILNPEQELKSGNLRGMLGCTILELWRLLVGSWEVT